MWEFQYIWIQHIPLQHYKIFGNFNISVEFQYILIQHIPLHHNNIRTPYIQQVEFCKVGSLILLYVLRFSTQKSTVKSFCIWYIYILLTNFRHPTYSNSSSSSRSSSSSSSSSSRRWNSEKSPVLSFGIVNLDVIWCLENATLPFWRRSRRQHARWKQKFWQVRL